MIIRMTVLSITKQRLMLLYCLKEHLLLGLKEAKDFMDKLHEHNEAEIDVIDDVDVYKFRAALDEFNDGYTVSGGLKEQREHKLLSLGIGTKIDYINLIVKYVERDKNNEIVNLILDKLDKEDLEEIINKIQI